MLSQIDLSIIVVTWNVRNLLERCLDTIFEDVERSSLEAEVFVIDNASTDQSAAMVRERFPQACLIENSSNVGFAVANNQGIKRASGAFVLLLNPDTEVEPGALYALFRHMVECPDVGASGPRLVGPDRRVQASVHRFPSLPRELMDLFHLGALGPTAYYPIDRWNSSEVRDVDAVQGACMLLRMDTLDEVGLLDEDYFLYSEEVDLCHRIVQAGWRVTWVPSSVVLHHGGQSTQQMPRTMFMHLYRSKVVYFRKRAGRLRAVGYKSILFVASLARVAVSPAALLEPADRRRRHLELASRYLRLSGKLWTF